MPAWEMRRSPRGNLRTAQADLEEAARLRPGDARIAGRLAVADTVLALDPTARDLSAHERYIRSRAVLVRTLASVGTCAPVAATPTDSAQTLLTRPIDRRGETMVAEQTSRALGSLEQAVSCRTRRWARAMSPVLLQIRVAP